MQITQNGVGPNTPLGANVKHGGATFRVWAPKARAVHLRIGPGKGPAAAAWKPGPENLLTRDGGGYWGGFVSGVKDGTAYRFFVVGAGGSGLKRDPYARELGRDWPDTDCVVRDPGRYPWHDQDYRTPAFNDLVVYQFHVGTYYAAGADGKDVRGSRGGTFLDVIDRVPYLADLGVNAIEPLPVVEFETSRSMGYNGTDVFSPEMRYTVPPEGLDPYVKRINSLLSKKGKAPLKRQDLEGQADQLRAMVDLCHVYGIAVLFDVVYNHAGGDFDDQSLYFLDREVFHSNNDSLYFTDQGWAGGLVFAYWRDEVRQFLIDNAASFLGEYHADGFRYDEVTVIDAFGGWKFCQDLTGTLRFREPSAVHIAEYWRDDQSFVIKPPDRGGAGFDAVWHTGVRESVRGAVGRAAGGRDARVDMDAVAASLGTPPGFSAAWRGVQHLENQDVVYAGHSDARPRIARLGDSSDARSPFARGRARFATAVLLTAPGVPMLFMGEEFLEDKLWSDDPSPDHLIWWDGLTADAAMKDFHAYTRDLLRVRRDQPALRGERANVYHVHNDNRVIAFHRWLDGVGRDVVVVASLNEGPFEEYALGFPRPGRWVELFNGDVYDATPNPTLKGNGGAVHADGGPMHGLPASASVVIPPHGVLVFAPG